MDKQFVVACQMVVLCTRERSQNVDQVILIKFVLMAQLVSSAFDPPPDVFVESSLQQVHRLGDASERLSIGVFCGIAKFVLIVSQKLF